MLKVLRLAGLLCAMLACLGASSESLLATAERAFLQEISKTGNTFEVTRYEASNRVQFYTAALALEPGTIRKVVEWRELTFRDRATGEGTHLGLAELLLSRDDVAVGSRSGDPPRVFAKGKIQTRYVLLKAGTRALLIYSETHLDAEMQRFLDGAAARPELAVAAIKR